MKKQIIIGLFLAYFIGCVVGGTCHADCGGGTDDGTNCRSGELTENDCLQCPGSFLLVYSTPFANKGRCTTSIISVRTICGAGKYGVYDTVIIPVASRRILAGLPQQENLQFCGASSGTSTTCVICKSTQSNCNAYAYLTAISGGYTIQAFDNSAYYNTEPSGFCIECTSASYFIRITISQSSVGTCSSFSSTGCQADEYVKLNINGKGGDAYGMCRKPVAVNTASAPIYSRQPCATYQTQTDFLANDAAALDTCITCPADHILKINADGDTSGQCVLKSAGTVTSSYCSDNSYFGFKTTTTTLCTTATTCAICKASTTNCATFYYKADATSGGAEELIFSTEPSDRCLTCQGSYFVKVSTAGNSAGSCIDWSSPGCSSTEAVFQDGSSGKGICLTPTAANTASAPIYSRKPCATYTAQTSWFANDGAALDACITCSANHKLLVANNGATFGNCVLTSTGTTTSAYCASNQYLIYQSTITSLCDTTTKCVQCGSSTTNCATFYYKADATSGGAEELVFSTEPSNRCLTCQGAGTYFVKVSTAGHSAGSCVQWSSPGCSSTEAVFQDGSSGLGICLTPAATNTVSAPTFSRKPCATYTAQTSWFANDGAALDACVTCPANHNIRVNTDSASSGQCVLTLAGTVTSSYCANNYYLAYKTSTTALCTSATTCVICKATSGNCATFSYKSDATSAGTAIEIFTSDPSNRCLTCQNPSTQFIMLADQAHIAGSCNILASHGCTTTQALISKDGTSSLYYCKVPSAATPKQVCQTYAYHSSAPHMTDSSALDDCNSCSNGQAWVVDSANSGSNTYGNCISSEDINSHCTQTKFLLQVSGTKSYCQTVVAATISGFTAQVCLYFGYSSVQINFANNNEALLACQSCLDSTNHQVVGGTNSQTSQGVCLDYSNNNQYCGTFGNNYYLKAGSFIFASYCAQATVGNSLPCQTYYYTSSQKSFPNVATACSQCATCDPRKLWVNPDAATTTYGKCVDSPKLPTSPCGANQWVQQRSGQQFQGFCTTTATSNNQEQCLTYYYGEDLFFPNGDTQINNKCLTCTNLLVKDIGQFFGKCYANAANANADCPAGAYLRKITQNGITFSYCQETPTPPSPFEKCTTYYYGGNQWLDVTPDQAYLYCASCTGGYILKRASINSYGSCYTDYTKVDSVCNANLREYIKYIDATFSICQAPDSLIANQVGCATYTYASTGSSLLYIASPGTDKCISCGIGELLVVSSDTWGRCFNPDINICNAGQFLQKVSNSNEFKCIASTSCQTFNYKDGQNNAIFWYIDSFQAEADCIACSNGMYAKIAGSTLQFKSCQTSLKCSAFVAENYASIEDAEKKCTQCNQGYYYEIATATDTFGQCVASKSCITFSDAYYLSTDTPNTKCTACASGYWYKKNDAGNYGSCELSTDCKVSNLAFTVGTTQTAESFSNGCTTCKSGFFKVAAATSTDSACKAFDATSNCLSSTNTVYADSAAASANCISCKENYFVKSTGSNAYGECTLLTKKYTCLQFTGVANDEATYASTAQCIKCPSDFYYNNNGQCVRCPGNCRTCSPNPSAQQKINGDFCTSCFDGYADLILYTNSMFGKCLSCGASCRSCGGIYVNTAFNENDRRCDSCGAAKIFAIESEFDAGICVDCLNINPNCLRCSSFGICVQCKDGFFQNKEGNCVTCKTDCAICRDAETCIVSHCVTGCAICSANTFDGCSKNSLGFFKDTSSYTQCYSGCLQCTDSTITGCTQWQISPTGTNCLANCKSCSGTAGTFAECTTVVEGYFKTDTDVQQCVAGCKTCTEGVFESCQACFDQYFKNEEGKVCDKCHKNCVSCNGPQMDQCTQCKTIDGHQTFIRLPSDQNSFGYCDFCDISCKTCGGRANSPVAGCTSCWSGKLLQGIFTGSDGTVNGRCIDSCPSGTFQEGTFCKSCILGSPAPCPQASAIFSQISSILSFTIAIFTMLILLQL